MNQPAQQHHASNRNVPRTLLIDAQITDVGIDILVNEDRFPIRYPREIWAHYPDHLKTVLRDNLAYSTTLFLPQMFGVTDVTFKTPRPASETFLFKNGIYDMPICALTDGASSRDYIAKFFNTDSRFATNDIALPAQVDFSPPETAPRAIVPFSFGKESLLTFALCRELKIDPVPVLFVEPANTFEHAHKLKLIEEFRREFGIDIHIVEFSPGIFRYGTFWGLKTELGWGLHTTEYALLALPFVHAFDATYVLSGNEHACNDTFIDNEGMRLHEAGYDQHSDWLSQQTLLASLLYGRKVQILSFMEPLYEIGITRILHRRFPQIGRYQMSCMADSEHARDRRWCQRCMKCGFMYALLSAADIPPTNVGFTENLFDADHSELYDYFFEYDPRRPNYGSQNELGLAFLLAERNGYEGASIERFRRELLPHMREKEQQLRDTYFTAAPDENIPTHLRELLLSIFREEFAHCNNPDRESRPAHV